MCAARSSRVFVFFLLASLLGGMQPATADEPVFAAYSRLLKRHVAPGVLDGLETHLVDYQSWAADPDYPIALQALAKAELSPTASDPEKIAFWINAYNLLAIKVVLDRYPMESIRDGGNFLFPIWKKTAGTVGGVERSLDTIEHEILRGQFPEPRIHMGLVCASLSCPDLRREVYQSGSLDQQLDDQSRRFLANRGKGLLPGEDPDEAEVSSIFRWFRGDFDAAGGVVKWIQAHAGPETRAKVQGLENRGISYLNYNWTLNDQARLRAGGQ